MSPDGVREQQPLDAAPMDSVGVETLLAAEMHSASSSIKLRGVRVASAAAGVSLKLSLGLGMSWTAASWRL